jgi:hypothetical protein
MAEPEGVDPFGRTAAELALELDLFNVVNAHGSRLWLEFTSDLVPGETRLKDVGIIDGWHVIRRETAADCPFWVLWLHLGWVVEPPTPPFLGWVHLMRIVEWDFDDGIWLTNDAGFRWWIEYGGEPWWDAFQAHKRKHAHEYFGGLRSVIQMCQQLAAATGESDKGQEVK